MIHEGEYHFIKPGQLEQFRGDGWTLVGRMTRENYHGAHDDSLLVRRPTSKLPPPDPPLEAGP